MKKRKSEKKLIIFLSVVIALLSLLYFIYGVYYFYKPVSFSPDGCTIEKCDFNNNCVIDLPDVLAIVNAFNSGSKDKTYDVFGSDGIVSLGDVLSVVSAMNSEMKCSGDFCNGIDDDGDGRIDEDCPYWDGWILAPMNCSSGEIPQKNLDVRCKYNREEYCGDLNSYTHFSDGKGDSRECVVASGNLVSVLRAPPGTGLKNHVSFCCIPRY